MCFQTPNQGFFSTCRGDPWPGAPNWRLFLKRWWPSEVCQCCLCSSSICSGRPAKSRQFQTWESGACRKRFVFWNLAMVCWWLRIGGRPFLYRTYAYILIRMSDIYTFMECIHIQIYKYPQVIPFSVVSASSDKLPRTTIDCWKLEACRSKPEERWQRWRRFTAMLAVYLFLMFLGGRTNWKGWMWWFHIDKLAKFGVDLYK